MSGFVSREELRAVLEDWQAGRRTAAAGHAWADARDAADARACEDDIAQFVLAELDQLAMNLVTSEDVPVLLGILALDAGDELRACEMIADRVADISLPARKQALAADPTYARFCRS